MRMRRGTSLVLGLALLSACQSGPKQPKMYYFSPNYDFTIYPSEAPPHARATITYKVVVRDRKSRQPIENGEGQIYSNNAEGAKTWDGFAYGPEIGTYYGKLDFVTAGLWAIGVRFRRDSLHPLEKIEWMQDVLNERPSSTP